MFLPGQIYSLCKTKSIIYVETILSKIFQLGLSPKILISKCPHCYADSIQTPTDYIGHQRGRRQGAAILYIVMSILYIVIYIVMYKPKTKQKN